MCRGDPNQEVKFLPTWVDLPNLMAGGHSNGVSLRTKVLREIIPRAANQLLQFIKSDSLMGYCDFLFVISSKYGHISYAVGDKRWCRSENFFLPLPYMLGCWTWDQHVAGSNPGLPADECNPGQVVNTHVPLSPSSVGLIRYQLMGGDALRLGR